uniref:S-formylglutathione hydrolase n=2 Tax=Parascaris univalens TaxID=6257 RepID=A0A915CG50_PARUN
RDSFVGREFSVGRGVVGTMLEKVSAIRCFSGVQYVFSHISSELNCTMKFGIYIPDLEPAEKAPILYYLSGLTCTEANFIEKSGFQRSASAMKIIVVNPDTSPRGVDIPGDSESYDFGKGAGFYVDALEPKWAKNYRMYSYVRDELPRLIAATFKECDPQRQGIFGHSMGGHGAIMIGLRNPQIFRSISAFAPICNPMRCAFGRKALTGYLGSDEEKWKVYDSIEVLKSYDGPQRKILVDQGKEDEFLAELHPEALEAVKSNKVEVEVRYQDGYDHSYFFVATFIEDHIRFHKDILTH